MARQRNLYEILEDHELGIKQIRATLARIGGGGVDHGLLAGLGDDDHPQYAKLAGAEFTGEVKVDMVAGTSPGTYAHIRLTNGTSEDVLLRNDGADMYFLVSTAEDDQWNSLRPLSFDLTTGLVNLGNGAKITVDHTTDPGLEIEGGETGNYWAGKVRFSTNEGTEFWDLGMRGATSSDTLDWLLEYYNGSTFSAILRYDVSAADFFIYPDVIRLGQSSSPYFTIAEQDGTARFVANSSYTQVHAPDGTQALWLGDTTYYSNFTTYNFRDASSGALATLTTAGVFKLYGDTSGNEYVEITPGDEIHILNDNPEIHFEEYLRSAAGKHYWFHHNNGNFYLLQDRSSTPDGTWDSPHPWYVDTNGYMYIGHRLYTQWTYDNTTATAANVYINTSYYLQRSTSSIRYKTDVEYDPMKLQTANLQPVSYWSVPDERRLYGFIAEDVAEVLPEAAVLNEAGEVEHYDHQVVLAAVAAQVNHLRGKVNRLEKLLAKR